MGTIGGTILFAGQKPTTTFLRRYTGYVEQFDTLLPMLTVKEMLLYTAELKRPLKETRQVSAGVCIVTAKHPASTYDGEANLRCHQSCQHC